MGKFFLSVAIGLVSGVICFFLSVAFLSILLLIMGAVGHTRPDMTLTYKAALPVAILTMMIAFSIALVRLFRAASKARRQQAG
jgi:hypothetical protein